VLFAMGACFHPHGFAWRHAKKRKHSKLIGITSCRFDNLWIGPTENGDALEHCL
jgi:hypothetical protein